MFINAQHPYMKLTRNPQASYISGSIVSLLVECMAFLDNNEIFLHHAQYIDSFNMGWCCSYHLCIDQV